MDLEERIEEEKVYLACLKYLKRRPKSDNRDSSIKLVERALLDLNLGQ